MPCGLGLLKISSVHKSILLFPFVSSPTSTTVADIRITVSPLHFGNLCQARYLNIPACSEFLGVRERICFGLCVKVTFCLSSEFRWSFLIPVTAC